MPSPVSLSSQVQREGDGVSELVHFVWGQDGDDRADLAFGDGLDVACADVAQPPSAGDEMETSAMLRRQVAHPRGRGAHVVSL